MKSGYPTATDVHCKGARRCRSLPTLRLTSRPLTQRGQRPLAARRTQDAACPRTQRTPSGGAASLTWGMCHSKGAAGEHQLPGVAARHSRVRCLEIQRQHGREERGAERQRDCRLLRSVVCPPHHSFPPSPLLLLLLLLLSLPINLPHGILTKRDLGQI